MKCPADASDTTTILDQYQRLTGFTVHDMDIPQKICADCTTRLDELLEFYEQCSRTEALLEEIRLAQPSMLVKKEEEIESDDVEVEVSPDLDPDPDPTVEVEIGPVPDVVLEYYKSAEDTPKEKYARRNIRKFVEMDADFSVFRPMMSHHDSEYFVLSYENEGARDLPETQDFNQHPDLFTCSYCEHQGGRLNGLKWHFLQLHPDAKWFQCPWCPFTCYNLDRMRIHTSTMKNHKTMAPLTPLRCDLCTYQTWQQVAMELHCEAYHANVRIFCECEATFPCRDLKLQHILLRCSQAPKTCRLPYMKFLNGQQQEEKAAKVVCEICGKAVAKKHAKYHKEIHHAKEYGLETIRFYCDLCNHSYKAKRELKLHMLKVHLKIASYTCNHCGRSFRNWNSRKYHVLTVHEHDLIRHECDVCGKKFASKFKMTEHRTMHSNIRKFQCPLCEKTYKNLSMLREHKSTVHATTRPYVCQVCGKSFKDRKGKRNLAVL